ncbi:phytoene desaturase family protein [Candidatus Leptofilum sp.]|uniref:phytoene desaturase family protein n=1 Tax=Candidatus Leptofilum sp. TaxID=3241576 RepID=UPI003B5B6086
MPAPQTVVVGAGLGGLTAGALLLKAGHRITVLEAHVYPGGCAGTFYHKKFRFDAGATLAGGFAPGGPHAQVAEKLGLEWPIHPVDPAWIVHLPDGRSVTQWTDPQQWQAERQAAFPDTESFWQRLEMLADIAWDVSSRPFPWPPESLHDIYTLARAVRPKTLHTLPYLHRMISSLMPPDNPLFRAFVDAQLLISAQTTSEQANALYGSAALDLPRRGVNHVKGGIGALADTLVNWIRQHGGEVLFRQKVTEIEMQNGRAKAICTNKGLYLEADNILANLTPWALRDLLGKNAPAKLAREVRQRQATWGAFTLYLGIESARLPTKTAGHHQIIVDAERPLGEGNSVFVSISDSNDSTRAPTGQQAVTLSTHTAVAPWWQLRHNDKAAYHARREAYAERLLAAAETALPGLRNAITLCLPGTPVTFEFFTRRPSGMVGGFPQKSILQARGPSTSIENIWLVGDSIFPGQSTAGVTLGGMRVANLVERISRAGRPLRLWQPNVSTNNLYGGPNGNVF